MRVLVSGGGTGGHIYPALALIREIKKLNPEARFLYIGTESGLESTIVAKAGIPFQSIVISGFKRKISLDNVKTVMRFLKGVQDSKRYIRRFNPDIVIDVSVNIWLDACSYEVSSVLITTEFVAIVAARCLISCCCSERYSVSGMNAKTRRRVITVKNFPFSGVTICCQIG